MTRTSTRIVTPAVGASTTRSTGRMIDVTHVMPPGAPFRFYRIDEQIPTLLAARGMSASTIAELLHDVGCGQIEAFTRLGETLRSRRQPMLLGRDDDAWGGGTLIVDAPLDATTTWSSGVGCAFIHTRSIPETVAALLPGRRQDQVIEHPALDGGRRIISVSDHGDGSRSLVVEARVREARRLPRRARRHAARRQREAQDEAFGSRPCTPADGPTRPPAIIAPHRLRIMLPLVAAWTALLTLAFGLGAGYWTPFPALGSVGGMTLVLGWAACKTERLCAVMRDGVMPDRTGRMLDRLDAARDAAGIPD